jgi:hypothetical protein
VNIGGVSYPQITVSSAAVASPFSKISKSALATDKAAKTKITINRKIGIFFLTSFKIR